MQTSARGMALELVCVGGRKDSRGMARGSVLSVSTERESSSPQLNFSQSLGFLGSRDLVILK